MSTTTTSSRTSYIQWLIESRPPGLTWSRPSPSQPNQPSLDLIDHKPDVAEAAAPDDRGVRVSMVKARWAAKQRPGLPDAQEWSTTLALAVIQALVGRRPVAHPILSKRGLARPKPSPGLVQPQGCRRRQSTGASGLPGGLWGENNNQWHPWRPITDRPQGLNVAKFSMKTPPVGLSRDPQHQDVLGSG
jgi:hypothetical protein